MTRARATSTERRRRRERWSVVAVIVVAALAGLIAAHFGTRQPWENTPTGAPPPTSASSVAPERTP